MSSNEESSPLLPRAMVALALMGAAAVVAQRALGWVPPDLSAYLAAVDVWRDGFNPYTDKIFDSPRSEGYPFLYPPASLWLFLPVDYAPVSVVAVLDGIARSLVAAGLTLWVRRRFLPDVELGWVALAAVMCSPLLVDAISGNLTTYMLGALALVTELTKRDGTPIRFAAILVCGVVLAVKPMWAIPAVYAVICSRRLWAFIALGMGGGSILIGSLAQRHLFVSWLRRVDEVAQFYPSVDFLKVAPVLAPLAALVWLVPAIYFAWKRSPNAWVFGFASVFMWPRLAIYSYVITAPLLAFVVARLGYRRGLLLALPVIGPLPWLLREPAGGTYERWMLLIWSIGLAGLVAWLIYRDSREGTADSESQ